jgi:hypothetical protein
MGKTPEGSVKDDCKAVLESYGSELYYFMPVQTGFGKRGLDIFICFKGMFIAAEIKRFKGYAKKFQEDLVEQVRDAHGHAIICDDAAQLKELLCYIEGHF